MSLRRLLNVAYTILAENGGMLTVTRRGRDTEMALDDWLSEPLYEDPEHERRRRAKANARGQSQLMGAFGMRAKG